MEWMERSKDLDRENLAALDAFVLARMQETQLPGLALSLVSSGMECDYRVFGFRDIETRRSVTPRTLFGLGSITKVFTALAIFQLCDRGLLDLDDRIDKWLDIDLEPRGEPIRVWHLLSHTSGIPALGFSESKMSDEWFMSGLPIATEADLLAFLQGADAWAVSPPGARWFYLNEGYLLLGRLIAQRAGQSYTTYVEQHILKPLQMERTHFARTRFAPDEDAATPYMHDRDGKRFVGAQLYGEMPAAGGLVSCAEDMAQLIVTLLNDGQLADGTQLISRGALQQMRTPRVRLPQEDASITLGPFLDQAGVEHTDIGAPGREGHFGCGLQILRNFYGHDLIGHGGGIMGGTTHLALMPERGVGAVLLSNAHGYPMAQLSMVVLAQMLGESPQHLPFLRIENVLARLAGSYTSFRNTIRTEVTPLGDLLRFTIRYHHEDRSSILIPLHLSDDLARFQTFSNGRNMLVEFRLDDDGIDVIFERYKFRKQWV
jgi:CubicO group peptidase (beta-lactamase class C family)